MSARSSCLPGATGGWFRRTAMPSRSSSTRATVKDVFDEPTAVELAEDRGKGFAVLGTISDSGERGREPPVSATTGGSRPPLARLLKQEQHLEKSETGPLDKRKNATVRSPNLLV